MFKTLIENKSTMHVILAIKYPPLVAHGPHPRKRSNDNSDDQTVRTGKAPVFFPARLPSGPRHAGYIPIRLWRIMMIVQQVHLPFHLLYTFFFERLMPTCVQNIYIVIPHFVNIDRFHISRILILYVLVRPKKHMSLTGIHLGDGEVFFGGLFCRQGGN